MKTSHAAPGLLVTVKITETGHPDMTLLERVISKLGSPQAIMKACDVILYITAGLAILYILAWTVVLCDAVTHRLHLSPVSAMVFSFAWIPLMALQPVCGLARYTAISLLTKRAQRLVEGVDAEFFQRIGETVTRALAEHMGEQEPPEKPTLQ